MAYYISLCPYNNFLNCLHFKVTYVSFHKCVQSNSVTWFTKNNYKLLQLLIIWGKITVFLCKTLTICIWVTQLYCMSSHVLERSHTTFCLKHVCLRMKDMKDVFNWSHWRSNKYSHCTVRSLTDWYYTLLLWNLRVGRNRPPIHQHFDDWWNRLFGAH